MESILNSWNELNFHEGMRGKRGSAVYSKKNLLWLLLGIVFVTITIYLLLLSRIDTSPEPIKWTAENTLYPYIQPILLPKNQTITIKEPVTSRQLTEKQDSIWLDVMSRSPIIGIDFNFTKGFSDKYKVYFRGGYVAVAKPLIPLEQAAGLTETTEFPTVKFSSINQKKAKPQRTSVIDRRLTQGWSEILAFHLDRVLKINRKPPIVGRIFNNHQFFAFDDSETSLKYRNLESFEYPLALVSWMEDIKYLIPTYENMGDILLMEAPVNATILKDLKDVSDTIVFDFLIDDHDKQKEHNWMGYRNKKNPSRNQLLLWDSGLAWLHGPDGATDKCQKLLCGPKFWRDENATECSPICRFHKRTIDNLKIFAQPRKSLGRTLEHSLKDDPLFPVVNYGLYSILVNNEEQLVHFTIEDFIRGLDSRVNKFLEHYQSCVDEYGEDEVLLPSLKDLLPQQ